jgi:hypothetical protein
MTPDWLPELLRGLALVQVVFLIFVFLVFPSKDHRHGALPFRYGITVLLAANAYGLADLWRDPALLRPSLFLVGVTVLSWGVISLARAERNPNA